MNAILSLITIATPLLGVVMYGQPGFIVGAGIGLAAFLINWKTGDSMRCFVVVQRPTP